MTPDSMVMLSGCVLVDLVMVNVALGSAIGTSTCTPKQERFHRSMTKSCGDSGPQVKESLALHKHLRLQPLPQQAAQGLQLSWCFPQLCFSSTWRTCQSWPVCLYPAERPWVVQLPLELQVPVPCDTTSLDQRCEHRSAWRRWIGQI